MNDEKIKVVTEALSHPKTHSFGSWLAAIIANSANWYVEFASPIVSVLVSILSLVLVITGIRVNTLKRKKILLEAEFKEKREAAKCVKKTK